MTRPPSGDGRSTGRGAASGKTGRTSGTGGAGAGTPRKRAAPAGSAARRKTHSKQALSKQALSKQALSKQALSKQAQSKRAAKQGQAKQAQSKPAQAKGTAAKRTRPKSAAPKAAPLKAAPSRRASSKPPARKPPKAPRRGRTAPAPKATVRRKPRELRLGQSSKRLRVGFLVVAFVMSVFAGRLLQLQGVEAAKFANAAVSERLREVTLRATRGEITDVNGVSLAATVDTVAVTADPMLTRSNAVGIAETLEPILKVPSEELVPKLRTPKTRFVYLARKVAPETWKKARDALYDEGLSGVFNQPDPLRSYPSGQVAANLVGFVGGEGKGLAGLEYALDEKLRGKDGEMVYERGTGGQQIPLAHSAEQDPVPGANIALTIDRDVQWVAQKALADQVRRTNARSGDVVVQEIRTGELVALATAPTYDPNHPTRSVAANRVNRPLQEMYEPGSVAKIMTAAALLDGGYVSPETKISVPGRLTRDGRSIGDWWGHDTINLTFGGALSKSSNIGTILAAERMPKAVQERYLRKFGIGQPTGIGLPGEAHGTLAPLDEWTDLRRATISFGQGLAVNAVQMASAVSTVANGGVRVEPSLIRGYVDDRGTLRRAPAPERTRVVSKEAAAAVTRMMEQVVDGQEALATKAAIPGYRIAGKTGTAQRADSTCGCYRGYTASFAGFAPADKPRFLVYVAIQDPKKGGNSGSGLAAPVFHDIMAFTLQKYGVPPTGTRTPSMPLTW